MMNKRKYNHSVDLLKYGEDGLKKRCKLCSEEKYPEELQAKYYCTPCWADYQREKRNGRLDLLYKKYQYRWVLLEEKYKDVKKCNTCKQIKNKNLFYLDKKSKTGYQNKCVSCTTQYNKDYNPYEKESNVITHKKYQEKNKDKWNDLQKQNYHRSPTNKMGKLLRSRLLTALKGNKKSHSIINLLGCSLEEFKLYLEKQFLPEMNWDNHGKVWEIDHIKPCASFDLTDIKQQQECFYYSNHQPLFKTTKIAKEYNYDNLKGNRNKSKF